MASNEPARDNWDDSEYDAPVEGRLLAPVATVRPAARASELRTYAWSAFLVGAGLAVWTGAIYGLLMLLSGPLS